MTQCMASIRDDFQKFEVSIENLQELDSKHTRVQNVTEHMTTFKV